ncbi:four helix bundle protein [Hymenobacter coalescens]
MQRRNKPHYRLDCWKRSFDFVPLAYALAAGFPGHEKFELASQLRRAATSVPLNIAEGAGRRTPKEFIAFLINARGSLAELDTIILLAEKLSYLSEDQTSQALQELDHISALVQGLLNRLQTSP